MPLTDLASLGASAAECHEKIDAVSAEAKELLATYDAFGGEHVPKSVRAAISEDWGDAASALTEEFLEHYPREDRLRDRKRVVKIEDALSILEDFEKEIISKVVLDPASLVSKATISTIKELEFVIEHAGGIVVTIIELFSTFHSQLLNAIAEGVWEFIKFIFIPGQESPLDAIKFAVQNYRAILAAFGALALTAAGVKIVKDMFSLLGQVHFKTGIKPVLTARKVFLAKADAKALPQGRGRVRRRRRGRQLPHGR